LKSTSTIRVRYAETDQMGVVYHTNFLIYFEVGRTDYFRHLGWTYRQMETENVFMPVTECFCRFLQPARYDDELIISTTLEMLSRLKLKFSYQVKRSGDSNIIAEGYTIHVPTNAAGKPCRIPAIYLNSMNNPQSAVPGSQRDQDSRRTKD